MDDDTLAGVLRHILLSSPEFNKKKFRDHRQFTAVLLATVSLFLPSLWIWDYITDPVGALDTISLRLTYLLIIPLAIGFWSRRARYRFLTIALPLTLLLSEAVFVEILNRLHTGMIHGMGGFMYAMLLSVLAGQCVPLVVAIGFTLAAIALPHLESLLGLAHNFPDLRYAILMWPAMSLTVVIQFALSAEYLRRYQLEAQLHILSDTDPLSGIANRRSFVRRFEQEIVRAQRLQHPLALLIMDIDYFKRINDTYGHAVGDRVIRHASELCQQRLRNIDGLGRIGGEEFAIFLVCTNLENAREIAERLRQQFLEARISISPELIIQYTVSIGVATLQPEDKNCDDLFLRADTALYAAKDNGRNRVMCA